MWNKAAETQIAYEGASNPLDKFFIAAAKALPVHSRLRFETQRKGVVIKMSEMREDIRRITLAITNITESYNSIGAKLGRQSSELWLLYVLDDGKPRSQKQICDEWGFPRTTLNTITKKCEAAGYLTLTPIPGKRREMEMRLTQKGKARAEQLLNIIHRVEDNAMKETLEKCSADFVVGLEYFSNCLKLAFQKELERAIQFENEKT